MVHHTHARMTEKKPPYKVDDPMPFVAGNVAQGRYMVARSTHRDVTEYSFADAGATPFSLEPRGPVRSPIMMYDAMIGKSHASPVNIAYKGDGDDCEAVVLIGTCKGGGRFTIWACPCSHIVGTAPGEIGMQFETCRACGAERQIIVLTNGQVRVTTPWTQPERYF